MGLRLSILYARFLLRTIGFHPEEITYGASIIRVLCKILLRAIGFHPEANSMRGLGYLSLMQDPIFGLLLFTRSYLSYIWKWPCRDLAEFYLAFGTA